METAHIVTAVHLLALFNGDERLIDRTLQLGVMRCFDYEPPDSPHLRRGDLVLRPDAARTASSDDDDVDVDDDDDAAEIATHDRSPPGARYVLRGRDALSREVLRANGGWYEGVEFTRYREIVRSSVDPTRRRVLVVYGGDTGDAPIICSLWTHYLARRKRYKQRVRTETDVVRRRVLECMEKMYKVVANSLYGYLNYTRSVVYAPSVAAAVTLLSRKTFHECAWICETGLSAVLGGGFAADRDRARVLRTLLRRDRPAAAAAAAPEDADRLAAMFRPAAASDPPRDIACEVIYRDTDGLIVFPRHRRVGRNVAGVSAAEQTDLEKLAVSLINGTFRRYGYPLISVDLEDSAVELCSIMGKKKYWKTLCRERDRFVTKGFERNAQPYVKHVVRVLQRNVATLLLRSGVARSHLRIVDLTRFFHGLFSALRDYSEEHGIADFAFNLALNPRSVSGTEASFIQSVIERHHYSAGDRARCVFVLNDAAPAHTCFSLLCDFNPRVHRLNFYKIVRRLVVYFVQLVEGHKRSAESPDNVLYMSPRAFDDTLSQAYATWLVEQRLSEQASPPFPRTADPLFRCDACDSQPEYVQLVSDDR